MRVSTEYLQNRFGTFNTAYFGGILPVPRFVVSNSRTVLGKFCCLRQRAGLLRRAVCTDFTIMVSAWYDVTERDYDNVLLHEMIHYYIAFRQLRDTSAHGPLFRREMKRLNALGWNINVTTRTGQWTVAERNRRGRYTVLALTTSDGRHFLSVVNPSYSARIDIMAAGLPNIIWRAWFVSDDDDYFAKFARARSLRGRVVPSAEFRRIVNSMQRVEIQRRQTETRR